MPSAKDLWDYLKLKGFTSFSGVPCSMLEDILKIAFLDPQIKYISAVRENAALGVASGAYLAGKQSAIFIQNSGLGNMINALTSFNLIYKIPVLMFITWRGYRGKDAPEHIIMGKKTLSLLKELNIPAAVLEKDFKKNIDWAVKKIRRTKIPVAIILKEKITDGKG